MNQAPHNPLRAADVERIVRQVLAELTGAGKPTGATAPVAELVLHRRVVSLADLEGRLQGVSRVVAPRGAVFTPAARDELKKYRVAIASHVAPSGAKAGGSVILATADTKFEPAPLVGALAAEGTRVERLPNVGLASVVAELAEQVAKGGNRGVLVTGRAAAAICLANRRPGVRAVQGLGLAGNAEAIASVGANLLVVDPQGRSLFELRGMVRELVRSQAPCPAELKNMLG